MSYLIIQLVLILGPTLGKQGEKNISISLNDVIILLSLMK